MALLSLSSWRAPSELWTKNHHHSLIYCNTIIFIIMLFLEYKEVAEIKNS